MRPKRVKTEDNKGTSAEGNFKIIIDYPDGLREVIRHSEMLDAYDLCRMMEKGEIEGFRFEWDE